MTLLDEYDQLESQCRQTSLEIMDNFDVYRDRVMQEVKAMERMCTAFKERKAPIKEATLDELDQKSQKQRQFERASLMRSLTLKSIQTLYANLPEDY